MRILILRELLASAATWVAATTVVAAGALAASIPAALFTTAAGLTGVQMLALLSLASTVTVLTALAIAVVLSGILRQTVEVRTRELAQWSVLGASPAQVRAVTVAQVVVVSLIGAAIGAVVGGFAAPAFLAYGLRGTVGIGAVEPGTTLSGQVFAIIFVVLVAILCAVRAGSRAAHIDPLASVRGGAESIRRRRRPPIGSAALAVLTALMLAGLPQAATTGASQLLLIGPLAVASIAAAPRALHRLERITISWVRTTPVMLTLARSAALATSRREGTAISSPVLTIGLPCGLIAGAEAARGADAAGGADEVAAVALLIAGPTILALVSAVGGRWMSTRLRVRDGAQLRAVGASRGLISGVAALESVVHAVTAAVVVTAVLAVVGIIESILLGRMIALPVLPLLVTALVSALALAATAVTASLASTAAGVPESLRSE